MIGAIRRADPARLAQLPFGTMPLDAAFAVYIGEFTTHAWDLVVALGRGDLLDDELAQVALELVTTHIPADRPDHAPFGKVVTVSADAPVDERLAGWIGRDPDEW